MIFATCVDLGWPGCPYKREVSFLKTQVRYRLVGKPARVPGMEFSHINSPLLAVWMWALEFDGVAVHHWLHSVKGNVSKCNWHNMVFKLIFLVIPTSIKIQCYDLQFDLQFNPSSLPHLMLLQLCRALHGGPTLFGGGGGGGGRLRCKIYSNERK